MIDINKPLELADGTTVEFVAKDEKYIDVKVHGYTRSFRLNGEHAYGKFPNLRNVQEEIPAHIKAYIDERIAALSEPVIDPDVVAVREIVAAYVRSTCPEVAQWYIEGKFDRDFESREVLAAYKKHKHA